MRSPDDPVDGLHFCVGADEFTCLQRNAMGFSDGCTISRFDLDIGLVVIDPWEEQCLQCWERTKAYKRLDHCYQNCNARMG